MTPRRLSSESIGLMRQSSLVDSLGNAAHEKSFTLLKSFIESKHAPSLLRRSAIYSMRNYHTDEVEIHTYLLNIALHYSKLLIVTIY